MQIKHLSMLVSGAMLVAAGGCGSGSDLSPTPTPDTRAEALLKQMTFAEKIQLVHGAGLGSGTLSAGPILFQGYHDWVFRISP
ncbi:MAG: Beta-glucosidase (EC [uncultured Paraburkholderia sp.]|nr:MAG: Beta-glucosidase (EC [uncultured Paraburkholderia sp.]